MPKENLALKTVKCHKCSQDTSYKATMVYSGKPYCCREWLQEKIQGMSIFDRINYAVDEENKHYREKRLEEFLFMTGTKFKAKLLSEKIDYQLYIHSNVYPVEVRKETYLFRLIRKGAVYEQVVEGFLEDYHCPPIERIHYYLYAVDYACRSPIASSLRHIMPLDIDIPTGDFVNIQGEGRRVMTKCNFEKLCKLYDFEEIQELKRIIYWGERSPNEFDTLPEDIDELLFLERWKRYGYKDDFGGDNKLGIKLGCNHRFRGRQMIDRVRWKYSKRLWPGSLSKVRNESPN